MSLEGKIKGGGTLVGKVKSSEKSAFKALRGKLTATHSSKAKE